MTQRVRLELDPAARARAATLGAEGSAWLDRLPDVIASLEDDWQVQVGWSLMGGTASWVGEVLTADGGTAVLKVALPQPDLDRSVSTLVRAAGRGYAQVLRHDLNRRALLLERLGPIPDRTLVGHVPLIRRGARVLREAWRVSRDARYPGDPDVDEKAEWLRRLIIDDVSPRTARAPDTVIHNALRLLDRRSEAWDLPSAVVVHGDAHIANMLPVLESRLGPVEGHVLIDPDGFVGDRAYDLGVLIREWNSVLLAADDPSSEVRAWSRLLADETGVDEQAIWEWAYIERVTSGLHLVALGLLEQGRPFLEVARLLR